MSELWLLVVLKLFFVGDSLAGRGGEGGSGVVRPGLVPVDGLRVGRRAGGGDSTMELLSPGRFSATARLAPASSCDLGALFFCRWSSPGSSSLSPVGGGVDLVVSRSSASPSCWYGETEGDDFPTAWKSPQLSSSPAPEGSGGGVAAARPCPASEFAVDGSPKDLIVIFSFFGVELYYRV